MAMLSLVEMFRKQLKCGAMFSSYLETFLNSLLRGCVSSGSPEECVCRSIYPNEASPAHNLKGRLEYALKHINVAGVLDRSKTSARLHLMQSRCPEEAMLKGKVIGQQEVRKQD